MEIIDIIRTRRTIKKFKQDAIDYEKILKWLSAAAMAPNHRMTEPWEIVFLGNEARRKLNHKTDFGNAPTVFVVLSKKGGNELEREENRSATSCFIQNFMLAAWAEGVGSFWSSIAASQRNQAILTVPNTHEVIGVIAVGYPEVIPEVKQRTPIAEKISKLQ